MSFFDLPREIRDMIYIAFLNSLKRSDSKIPIIESKYLISSNMVMISHQFRTEFLSVIPQFHFQFKPPRTLSGLTPLLQPSMHVLPKIQYLDIGIHGWPEIDRKIEVVRSRTDISVSDVLSLFPNLLSIRLEYMYLCLISPLHNPYRNQFPDLVKQELLLVKQVPDARVSLAVNTGPAGQRYPRWVRDDAYRVLLRIKASLEEVMEVEIDDPAQ